MSDPGRYTSNVEAPALKTVSQRPGWEVTAPIGEAGEAAPLGCLNYPHARR